MHLGEAIFICLVFTLFGVAAVFTASSIPDAIRRGDRRGTAIMVAGVAADCSMIYLLTHWPT